jgi:CBS domain-containing protein
VIANPVTSVLNAFRELVGIFEVRDIVRGFPSSKIDLNNLKVSDLMTSDVITCNPEDDVSEIMVIMDENHICHIPVLETRISAP